MNWPDFPQLWSLLSVNEERWKFTYPDLKVDQEVLRMGEWLEANPKRHPRNWKRFMVNWLAKNQRVYELTLAREAWQREQQRADAMVGKYRG